MDFRNEYRVRPDRPYYIAEYRSWLGRFVIGWRYIGLSRDQLAAEQMCREHAGEGTKYLGRLP